ncbi:MaoC family dehydratase N-terminal domain-containing protein [Micromonospora sp. CPCC 205371]|nr:MaoC family dehydratase N-terminal domain-containing protein [Micromonospora sp. CPCC 205371]
MSHPFDLSVVDRWSDERTFDVTPDAVQAYADAVGGPSPVFAVVPAMDLVFAVAETAVLAAESADLRNRVVHGQHDLLLHKPLPVGEKVTVRAAVVGLHGKRSGTTATIQVRTRDAAGDLLNEQYVTEFYRGIPTDLAVGVAAPRLPSEPPAGEPAREAAYHLELDLPARYANASGDHNPIHLDDEVARAAGLPGVIVHGLASLAIAARVVLAAAGSSSGASALARLSCRFTHPIAPGDTLTTRVWADGAGYRFDGVNEAGTTVLGAGVAELHHP